MKKLIISLGLSSMVAVAAFAQGPAAGRLFMFGSVGFSSNKSGAPGTNAINTLSFSPGVGYFLNDNIALGARLIISSSSSNGKSVSSIYGLGVFGRYYITKDVLGAKGSLFFDANLYYSSSKNPFYGGIGAVSNSKPTNTIGFGIAPGFALFPTPKWGFELTMPNVLGFYSSSYDGKSAGNGFDIGASTISGPQLTVVYFIK